MNPKQYSLDLFDETAWPPHWESIDSFDTFEEAYAEMEKEKELDRLGKVKNLRYSITETRVLYVDPL